MDPKIAAGFSLLGNALMPDPGKLAQAEVYRSQMLENQANARKLGLEGDVIANTSEQMALLQDLLANRESTPEDIISRAIASGLTNDPTQIPRLALGAIGTRGLDINDPDSLSKALLATGTVAGQANTPTGFAQDQARLEREAVAKDLTTRQGHKSVYDASIYDTNVDAETSIETQHMQDLREIGIATADRNLTQAVEAAQLAKDYYDINKDSNDAAIRLGAESNWKQKQLALDAAIARNRDATDLEKTRLTNAGDMDEARLNADAALERTRLTAGSALEGVKYAADARNAGGVGEPTISRTAAIQFQRDIKNKMARMLDPTIDISNKNSANVDAFLKGKGKITLQDLNDLTQLAFKLHPKDNIAAFETAMSLIRRDETGQFYIDNRAWDALVLPGEGDAETGEDATDADDATMAPALVPEDTGAGMVTPPPGGWTEGVDRKQAPNGEWAVFDGTQWLWEATGKPAG